MSKELEEMEAVETATEKRKWTPKPLTEEEIASVKEGIEKMKEMGVSEDMAKALAAVPDWKNADTDVQNENRKALVAAFDNKQKEYFASEEFKTEFEPFKGIAKAIGILGQIAGYYSRITYTPKPKMKKVTIGGVLYQVNPEYLESIKNDPDRRQLLLAHADTKKIDEEIEEF